MKWEQEVYIDHNRVKNNMEKGYRYLVNERNPEPDDVDSDEDDYLYQLLTDELKGIKSYFHVGFSMGRTLVSMHRLRPDIEVGGITWFDGSVAYGQQLFNLVDHQFKIQVGEYPYKPIVGEWDFINLGRLPCKSNLGAEILMAACQATTKHVFFFADHGYKATFPDGFDCVFDFDSDLEFLPCLLTRKKVEVPEEDNSSVFKTMTQNIEVSKDFGREDLPELGKRGDYHKFVDFPVEITEPIKIVTDEEDTLVNDGVVEEELKEFFNRETESHDTDGE